MSALRRIVPVLSILVFFAACSDGSLFIPDVDESPEVDIITIADGAVVGLEDQIPLDVQYAEGARSADAVGERLEVTLTDAITGAEVARTTLDADALMQPELPPIELSEVPGGFYRLELELWESGTVRATKRVEFFHITEDYRVLGIATYPPAFYPGASGLLEANVDVPEDSDPYLRWSLGDEVISEGPLSEGADRVIVRSPQAEGVYPVRLELFPMAPIDRLQYAFESSLSQTTDIYVTESIELEAWELGPEISYYTLFHFRGETRDAGVGAGRRGSSLEAEAVGGPDLRIHGDIFGFHLDGESGFILDRVAVPFDSDGLAPFSINTRILFESDDPGQRLVRTESTDGEFALELSTADAGALQLTLATPGATRSATSDAFLVRTDEALAITVSVFPLDGSAFVMWFRNGILVGVSDLGEWPSGLSVASGTTRIGGDGGIVGIVDELGVYFQTPQAEPSTYDEAFSHAMAKRYGDTLVYAEDFSGLTVPEDIAAEGDVGVLTGELLLEPGSKVVLPRFLFSEEDLLVEVDSTAVPAGTLSVSALTADDGEPRVAFILGTDGTLIEPAPLETAGDDAAPESGDSADNAASSETDSNEPVLLGIRDQDIAFRLVHGDETLELVGETGSVAATIGDAAFEGVVISLANDAEAAVPLRLMSVLVRRGQSAISRALAAETE